MAFDFLTSPAPSARPQRHPHHAYHLQVADDLLLGSPWRKSLRLVLESQEFSRLAATTQRQIRAHADRAEAATPDVLHIVADLQECEKGSQHHQMLSARATQAVSNIASHFAQMRHLAPKVCEALPDESTLTAQLTEILQQAETRCEAIDAFGATARTPTRDGEIKRGDYRGVGHAEKAFPWVPPDAPESPTEPEPLALPAPPADPRLAAFEAVANYPSKEKSWFLQLREGAMKREGAIWRTLEEPKRTSALEELQQAGQQLRLNLEVYSEILRHNVSHPHDPQDSTQPFEALADAYARIRGLIERSETTEAPLYNEFCKWQGDFEARARTQLGVPSAAAVPEEAAPADASLMDIIVGNLRLMGSRAATAIAELRLLGHSDSWHQELYNGFRAEPLSPARFRLVKEIDKSLDQLGALCVPGKGRPVDYAQVNAEFDSMLQKMNLLRGASQPSAAALIPEEVQMRTLKTQLPGAAMRALTEAAQTIAEGNRSGPGFER